MKLVSLELKRELEEELKLKWRKLKREYYLNEQLKSYSKRIR
jgi:ATP-dependent Lon protease